MIGLIYVGDIRLAPFVKSYTRIFDKYGAEYEIINWDRNSDETKHEGNIYTFGEKVIRLTGLTKKLKPMLRFRKYAKSIIKMKQYSKLVILTTQTAVLLPELIFKYKDRYIFDYRDASYEYIGLYRAFVNKASANAAMTALSSPGFREFFKDSSGIVLAHNFQREYYDRRCAECNKKEPDKPIVMGYIGLLRELVYLKKQVDYFGRDPRFEFHIHGAGDDDDIEKLRKYAMQYPNVKIYGKYDEKDKCDIVDTFDIICYSYPYSFVNYPAVANKFYDGLMRKKPMYANSRTFSGKLVSEIGVGISVDEDDPAVTDKIFDYYRELDPVKFASSCEKYLDKMIEDGKVYDQGIVDFMKNF